jgi:hypothetical protein
LRASSAADLVMVVVAANGTVHCDDDSGGNHDPLVTAVLPPGDHRVWVGPYSQGEEHPFSLSVQAVPADAVPDETGLASLGRPSLGVFEPAGESASMSWQGTSQSMVNAQTVDPECRGWLTIGPQVSLKLAEPTVVRLRVESAQDAVLFLRLADGTVRCDDDSGPGNAPLISAFLPAGEHRVWAGSFDQSRTDFALYADARRSASPPDSSGLAVSAPPSLGLIDTPDTPGGRFQGTSRGFAPVSSLAQGCHGFVPLEPHFDLRLAGGRDVQLGVEGTGGLGLVVQHPGGGFECDPAIGRLRGMWPAGVHRIWIGVPAPDQELPFTLDVRTAEPSIQPWSPN